MCELSVGDEVLQMNGMTVARLSQVFISMFFPIENSVFRRK